MKKRYRVLLALSALSVVTFLDRIAINSASSRIADELHLSTQQLGWVLGIFAFSYGIFEIPTGLWGDKFGAKKVLIRVVLWWSVFTFATGLVTSFLPLLFIRFLFGAGEAGAYPNASIVLSKWFPASERARSQSIIWTASRIGGFLTPLLVIPIQIHYGWRVSFYLLGILGISWAAFWHFWHKEEPSECADISPNELSHILEQRQLSNHSQRFSWAMFRNLNLVLLLAMYFCYASGSFFFQSWLTKYLKDGRGIAEQDMKWLSSLPFIMGAIGCLAGGFVSDFLSRKWGVRQGRRAVASVGLAIAGILLFISVFMQNQTGSMLALALAMGFMDATIPCSWATAMDIGGKNAGSTTGAMNTAGLLGSTICTISFGYLVAWQGYALPVVLLSFLLIIGSVLWLKIEPR